MIDYQYRDITATAYSTDIKVLVGESFYYYLLHHYDQEFSKLFKIRADFDDEMQRSRRNINDYARLISSVCEDKGLKHFNPEAVASIVEYGSRMTDDQKTSAPLQQATGTDMKPIVLPNTTGLNW